MVWLFTGTCKRQHCSQQKYLRGCCTVGEGKSHASSRQLSGCCLQLLRLPIPSWRCANCMMLPERASMCQQLTSLLVSSPFSDCTRMLLKSQKGLLGSSVAVCLHLLASPLLA